MSTLPAGEIPAIDPSHYFLTSFDALMGSGSLDLQQPGAQAFLDSAGLPRDAVRYLLGTDFEQEVGPPEQFQDYNTVIVEGVAQQVIKEDVRLWGGLSLPGVASVTEVADCRLYPLQPDAQDVRYFRFPIDETGSTTIGTGAPKPSLGFEMIHIQEGRGKAYFMTRLEDGDLETEAEVSLEPRSVIIMRSGTLRKVRTDPDSGFMQLRHTSNMEWIDPKQIRPTMLSLVGVQSI